MTMRFVHMSLEGDPNAEPAIVIPECTLCRAAFQPVAGDLAELREKAELWCLDHAAKSDEAHRHHTGFRVNVTMHWRVVPEGQPPGAAA
ncbi:hypothetical protein [Streptomyces sp. NPDC056707]|uniref:DUF7848 domain-containing protein n=1 Tax=Streptomyces sp. NPDC056707 TaxID=3345919 RepID=UPI0036B9D762